MMPNGNPEDMLKQLGLLNPPPSYADLLRAGQPAYLKTAGEPLPATGPMYADEALPDPTLVHKEVPTEMASVGEDAIPLKEAASGQPVTSLIPRATRTESSRQEQQISMPSPLSRRGLMLEGAQDQVMDAQDELERLRSTGSGISQIKNPFVRTLARIGDVAGTVMFPSAMNLVPGTTLHHNTLMNEQGDLIHSGLQQIESLADSDENFSQSEYHRSQSQGTAADIFGKTPESQVMRDLLTGNEGGPRVNEETGKPWTYDEAFKHVEQTKQDVRPTRENDKLLAETGYTPEMANKAFERRYQVLYPGKPLPPDLTLGKNATVGDYGRADKELQDLLQLYGTKQQRDIANEIRRLALAASEGREGDRKDKNDRTIVQGMEPDTGRVVMTSAGNAEKFGLTDIMDMPTAESGKALSGRHWLMLVYKNNPGQPSVDDPEAGPGVLELIDKLDKDGKLGVIASRWNEFITGAVGAGDPDFERLRIKMGLSKTLLMNLHVGNRGGAYMFEHFEDLANQGKMNAQTLKAGVLEEVRYAMDRAMIPTQELRSYIGDRGPARRAVRNPRPAPPQQTPSGGKAGTGKSITKAQVQAVATRLKISYEAAKKDAINQGYEVKE